MTQWKVTALSALEDNYIFVIHNLQEAIVIDPGEASPVINFLYREKLLLKAILLTHHHWDHVDGAKEIRSLTNCKIYSGDKCSKKLKFNVDRVLNENEKFHCLLNFESFPTPGHTLDQIAFYAAELNAIFSGDLIFALGCGRLFEGTHEEAFKSLTQLKKYHDDTKIYAAHNYFTKNKEFCESQRINTMNYQYSCPLILRNEKAFNPFLKSNSVEAFKIIREHRNHFE